MHRLTAIQVHPFCHSTFLRRMTMGCTKVLWCLRAHINGTWVLANLITLTCINLPARVVHCHTQRTNIRAWARHGMVVLTWVIQPYPLRPQLLHSLDPDYLSSGWTISATTIRMGTLSWGIRIHYGRRSTHVRSALTRICHSHSWRTQQNFTRDSSSPRPSPIGEYLARFLWAFNSPPCVKLRLYGSQLHLRQHLYPYMQIHTEGFGLTLQPVFFSIFITNAFLVVLRSRLQ